MAAVPVTLVPIRLPAHQVAARPESEIQTPAVLPEITLLAPLAPCRRSCCLKSPLRSPMPTDVGDGGGAGIVGADQVALDQVAVAQRSVPRCRAATRCRCRADRVAAVVLPPSSRYPAVRPLGTAAVPAALVPIKFPVNEVAGRAAPVRSPPSTVLPEITLPAPPARAADRVPGASIDVDAVVGVGDRGGTGEVGADEVALRPGCRRAPLRRSRRRQRRCPR